MIAGSPLKYDMFGLGYYTNCNVWFTQTTKTNMKMVNFASFINELKLKPF